MEFFRVVHFVTLFYLASSSRVQLRNNYYTDLTISLPDVQDEKKAVLSSLAQLLDVSNRILFRATKGRAVFATVNVLVPESWGNASEWLPDQNTSFLFANGGHVTKSDADIIFGSDAHQEALYTLNADGCGKRGERIHFPMQLLSSSEPLGRKGKRFVQEWAQYRYGVFPESGFFNDSQYPHYYGIPGTNDVLVTSCTNTLIGYNFTDQEGNSCKPVVDSMTGRAAANSAECRVVMNSEDMSTTISSIMDSRINAKQFCDADLNVDRSHNVKSVSKHNALCFEDGTWFVILRSEDFAGGKNSALRYRKKTIQLRYIQESNLRIVIAVDVSSGMKYKDRYNRIKNGLKKFILHDVPLGSEIGLIFFAGEIEAIQEMTLLTDEVSRESFLETGKIYDEPLETNDICTECALIQGAEMLRSDNKNGIILLVTSNPDLNNTEEILNEEPNFERIRLCVIQFSSTHPQEMFKPLKILAESTAGSVVDIPDNDETAALLRIYMAFPGSIAAFISSSGNHNSILLAKDISDFDSTSFDFDVDEFVGDITLLITGPNFLLSDSPFEEVETKLETPNGSMDVQKDYFIPAWKFQIPNALPGTYKFTTRRKSKASSSTFAMVLGGPNSNGSALHLRAWVSFQKEEGYPPIKIFAELRNGFSPVRNAEVIAFPYGSGGETIPRFKLVDDGLGDPDITQYDGIYSSYFVNYTSPGYYNVFIQVTGTDRTETVFVSSDDCCGSSMPSYKTTQTGKFERLTYVSFPITKVFEPEDAPPGRIMNLRMTGVNLDKMEYNLTWSSVGADYNIGTATSYELKMFSSRNDAKRRFERTGILMEYNRNILYHSIPDEYELTYVVQLPETIDSGYYYFAVRAKDEFSNIGQVSNIVEFVVSNQQKGLNINCSQTDSGDKDDGGGGGAFPSVRSNSVVIIFTFCFALTLLRYGNMYHL